MTIPKGTQRVPNRKLQSLRINRGLSPNDLGYLAGVSGKTIRFVEAGHTPHPRIQFAIAEVFGLLPLDLWPLHGQRNDSRRTGAGV
jgi:DNA-binding XRE family transcriptional regulator